MGAATIALGAVLARTDLELTLLAGAVEQRRVRWVHICELRDPSRYLAGGELLLTAGVDFPPTEPEISEYVLRLVEAGAAAIGFGVTPVYDEVPAALVSACRQHGLPLLAVPKQTSFLVIGQTVSLMLAAKERAGLRRLSVAQGTLTRAAAGRDGVEAVVGQLAAALGGWTALVDSTGRQLAAGGPPVDEADRAELPELIGRLGERPRDGASAITAATVHRDSTQLVAHALPVSPPLVLVAGLPAPFSTADHAILGVGVALLSVVAGARRPPFGEADVVAALLALALDTDGEAAAEHLAAGLGVEPGGWWQVVHARRAAGPGRDDRSVLAGLLGTPLVAGLESGAVRALVAGRQPCRLGQDGRWQVGVSPPVPWAELPSAARRAQRLFDQQRAPGGLDTLVPAEAAAGYAAARLAPLADNRVPGSAVLVETLRAWLAGGGGWESAASALGVHRNTVRHRVAMLARLLDCDLDNPDTRAELWLALRWLPDTWAAVDPPR